MFVSVLCVFLMMTPGYVARRKGWIRAAGVRGISAIHVSAIYPCLIISSITENFTLGSLAKSFSLPATSLGIMCMGYAIGMGVSLFIKFRDEGVRSAFLFQTALNNYSFFPMALVMTLYGMDGVAKLIFSSLGAEVVIWTLGVFILNGHRLDKQSLKHLISPPLAALYTAVGLLVLFHVTGFDARRLTDRTTGGWLFQLHSTFKVMGQATIPLAMLVGGARLATITLKDVMNKQVWLLTVLRLVIIPTACIALMHIVPLGEDVRQIMIIVALMPVSLASLMLSELYGGDKALINGSVLLTHALSLVTVPLQLHCWR